MFTTRLFAFAALAAALANAATLIEQAQPASNPGALNLNGTNTDSDTIANTATTVDQKSGASSDDLPADHPPPPTTVTAVDGDITNQTISSRRELAPIRRVPGRFARSTPIRRDVDGFEQVFAGTGTGPTDRDGSVEGTAYLTFTTVNNSTYNVNDCVTWCLTWVPGCVFVNLYYEYNNPGLDAGSSNLKCAAYADVHAAAEKTNTGGQQLYPAPGGLTYIQQSSGWAATSLEDPATPDGYSLVFGPTNGANNAPGYMGFAFLTKYDVQACADLCNTRGADANGGGCQYFNIWRAVVNGSPTTYTCSMYYVPSDASTAVNYGQGDLKVTFSRGYKRLSVIPDGGFESYFCPSQDPNDLCWTETDANWIGSSPPGGHWDALIFSHAAYAHSGHSVASFGSGDGSDSDSGTLVPAQTLNTVAGRTYSLQLFYNSNFNSGVDEANASLEIIWNGQTVSTIKAGNSPWTFYQFTVVAKGNDQLKFFGGSFPAYVFLDDINLFLA